MKVFSSDGHLFKVELELSLIQQLSGTSSTEKSKEGFCYLPSSTDQDDSYPLYFNHFTSDGL